MKIKAENIEIRGVEIRQSKKTANEYLIVRVEDETGRSYELLDRDLENKDCYKRGIECDLTMDLRMGKYSSLTILKMDVHK